MRFRAGLLVGGVAGYVLGSRAGRERYHQIVSGWRKIRQHPAASQLFDQAIGLADAGRHVIAGGLSVGGRRLRAAGDSNGQPDVRIP